MVRIGLTGAPLLPQRALTMIKNLGCQTFYLRFLTRSLAFIAVFAADAMTFRAAVFRVVFSSDVVSSSDPLTSPRRGAGHGGRVIGGNIPQSLNSRFPGVAGALVRSALLRSCWVVFGRASPTG